jgi:lipopolysaccharide biosynthesis protein/cephalosporin hydroxylase
MENKFSHPPRTIALQSGSDDSSVVPTTYMVADKKSPSLGGVLELLQVGKEVLLEPEWLRPFEHWVGHIPFAFWIISALKPRIVVELGTHRGNSYLAFCQAIAAFGCDSRAYAVDTWEGDEHMAREAEIFAELSEYHDPRYGNFSSLIRSKFNDARSLFADGSIDLLHIDGTHTYEAVANDFAIWESALSDRAIVLMHDTNVRRDKYEVWKLWKELSDTRPNFEFFHSYGLGVLGVGKNFPASLNYLFNASANQEEAALIRSFFSSRGRTGLLSLALQMQSERSRTVTEAMQNELIGLHKKVIEKELLQTELEQNKSQIELFKAESDNYREKAKIGQAAVDELKALKNEFEKFRSSTALMRHKTDEIFLKRSTQANIKITELKQLLDDKVNVEHYLESKVTLLQSQVNDLLSSTCWRLTSPLRAAATFVPASFRNRRLGERQSKPEDLPNISLSPDPEKQLISSQKDDAKDEKKFTLASPVDKIKFPDLFELRFLKPTAKIAVVAHIFYPELCDELLNATDSMEESFDLFVTLVEGFSDHLKETISWRFPEAKIWVFPNRGRDILPFMMLVNTGALFKYELICKLHTKRSPHRLDGEAWRQHLISGVLPNRGGTTAIISTFHEDPDLGMVVADGQIFGGADYWAANIAHLEKILPLLGFSVEQISKLNFAGGSIFWIRPWLLRELVALNLQPETYEPEPVSNDGSLAHAVERLFSVACHAAGMKIQQTSDVLESLTIEQHKRKKRYKAKKTRVLAFYLPQYHPIPENDLWWGEGFTEWTNVTKANPLFSGHRQPRLPGELGFTDLRLPETRKAQADLAKAYGISAFCYYYYWFDEGRRLLQRPLDEVLESDEPDFPFMICWANEPWSRNWDGLNKDVLVPQSYSDGWIEIFARDIAPILKDRRYVRLNENSGPPVLFIYRVMSIPNTRNSIESLRIALRENGIPEVHIAAGWVAFPDNTTLPESPTDLGLDAYFEFPPHRIPAVAVPALTLSTGITGGVYDYAATVDAVLARLDEQGAQAYLYRSAMMGWDNTARRGTAAHVFKGATPGHFRRWLRGIIRHNQEFSISEDQLIFINAWNEWAEGTCLEPDREFGRGWLEAVQSALNNTDLPDYSS